MASALWHGDAVIAVATTEAELDDVCARLRTLGCRRLEVVAPGGTRRVVVAVVADEAGSDAIAAKLRSEGLMAVARPDGGPRLERWIRDSRPLEFGDRLTVCRAWSEYDRDHLPGVIELAPGGFGTGDHRTTRLVIEGLVDRVGGGERVLDVGCGSGVLALCALRLGAASAVGVDLDPAAVDATRRSAALNGMAARMEATTRRLADVDGTFDVVVANIARQGVVALAEELVSHVAPGGWLAVSGIASSQCSQVSGFLRPLVEVDRRASGEWAVLVLQRRHPLDNNAASS